MGKIHLVCVKEKNKLRIKFHKFIDDDNKEYFNLYDNTYNCQFPKNIRVEGYFYEVDENSVSLIQRGNNKPFYDITSDNIKILNTPPEPIKIYLIPECCVCLSEESSITFFPCGHKCICSICNNSLTKRICPICRRNINSII